MTSIDWGGRLVCKTSVLQLRDMADLGVCRGAVSGVGYAPNGGSTEGGGRDPKGKAAAEHLGALALGAGLAWAWSSPSASSSFHQD